MQTSARCVYIVTLVAATTSALGGEWRSLPNKAPSPKGNPTTVAKVELGKKLFFDPRLSLTGTVSCNSCHNLMEGGDDGRPTSMGIYGRLGPRNAPTVWNSAFQASQFWDGRSPSLEDQAKGPIIAEPEMGMPSHDKAIERIAAISGYRTEFRSVFGNDKPVTIANAVKAIAAFERTLITPNSPFDRYVSGDKSALTAKQLHGMKLFDSVGCTECHSGPVFNGWEVGSMTPTFEEFPRTATSRFVKRYQLAADLGRFEATKQDADKHTFKVPTLRNITITAPYMHNGAVPTLDEAIRLMADTQLDTTLTNDDVSSIASFLSSLEGSFPTITMPRLPSLAGKSILDDRSTIMSSKDEATMQQHGSPIGRGRGMMGRGRGGGMRPDMTTIHAMFAARDKIKRVVKNLPKGAEATTESDDAAIVGLIQEHVPAMESRVLKNNPLPPMTFHPIFVALIKRSDDYALTYEETDKGVKVKYTSDDPYVVMLVQEHAKLVSRFIKNGMQEIHKPYTLPWPND